MASFDLKPLNREAIDQLGLTNHDLWMVKIGEEILGPFETEALKEYSSQNESHFDEALASRVENNDFRPFWSHAFFQRRTPQVIKSESHEGPFWILDYGQKFGPFSYREIDKKIEMGLLSMTDHISTDNGSSWIKIFEIEGFDRRSHSADELPEAPFESSFQKAKLELLEKIESPHTTVQDELAELAYQGQEQAKVLAFKLDEFSLQTLKSTEVSEAMKWAIPGAAALVLTFLTTGYFALSPNSSEETLADVEEVKLPRSPNPSLNIPRAQVPSPKIAPTRYPASVAPASAPRDVYQARSRFPTQIETHQDIRYDEPRDDYYDERYPEDGQQPVQKEHSLVSNGMPEDQSLDAAMNGIEQPVEPVVEESSDF